jgi:uncharacterized membrane protein (DUF485 family)
MSFAGQYMATQERVSKSNTGMIFAFGTILLGFYLINLEKRKRVLMLKNIEDKNI